MKANEFVTEIARIASHYYAGGKGDLSYSDLAIFNVNELGKFKPTDSPGIVYTVVKEQDTGPNAFTVLLYDKANANEQLNEIGEIFPIALLRLMNIKGELPKPNAVKVESITVDEDYRGRGLAQLLYRIVLVNMKKVLLAGSEQTPGGRKNWTMLASEASRESGIEVTGYLSIYDSAFTEATIKKLSDDIYGKMGAQYLGSKSGSGADTVHYYEFPVKVNVRQTEIENTVNSIFKVYGGGLLGQYWNTGLIAQAL